MKAKKGITAAELVAQLNADPEYVARWRKQQEQLNAVEEVMRFAERPLVQALNDAGLGWVRSVWDLVNTATPYLKPSMF